MPKWLPQVLGYCTSAACLIWVLHGYSIKEELLPAIRELDWRWVSVAIAANLAVFVVQAWQWNTLLAPVIEARLGRTSQAIFIGQFFNQVLPLRPGELIRCYLFAHWNDLRLSLSFASAAVERLIDGFWMLGAFVVTAMFVRDMPHDLILGVQVMGVFLVIGAVGLAWVVFHKQHAHAVLSESRWAATLRHVVEGLHLMGNPRTMGLTVLLSLLYLAVQVFMVWALMKADQMDLSLWAAGGVLAVVRLAIVVPSGPANLGLFQFACVLALGLFDVERNDAKNFANILLATETLPLLVAGAISVALTGLNLKELRERAHHGAHAHKHPRTHGPA